VKVEVQLVHRAIFRSHKCLTNVSGHQAAYSSERANDYLSLGVIRLNGNCCAYDQQQESDRHRQTTISGRPLRLLSGELMIYLHLLAVQGN
jgi:hypothetical protein